MKIELETNYLKAMLLAIPTNDVRYNLCGLNMVAKGNELVAFAVDGHRISKWLISKEYEGEDFNVIFDKVTIKAVVDSKIKEVELDTEKLSFKLPYGEASKLIDGTFPDANKVLNASTNKNVDGDCFIDTKYLVDIAKIGNLICKKNQRCKYKQVNSSPDSVVLFAFLGVDNFIHGVMPMRDQMDIEIYQNTLADMLKKEVQL